MVSSLRAAVVGGLVLILAGSGMLVLEGLVRRVDILGSRHREPCLRSACAEVCFQDAACWPLRVGEERSVGGSAPEHDPHVCVGDVHYCDGGPHEA